MNGLINDFVVENNRLKEYRGCSEEIIIPDGVTVIGTDAFRDKKAIRSVIMSRGLKRIEENAFRDCSNLHTVRIPRFVTSLGFSAFQGCPELNDIEFFTEYEEEPF